MNPLKELRTALGLSQEALAASIDVYQSQVSSHERTGAGIGREGLLRLADRYRTDMNRLGLTVEDLLRGTRTRSPVGASEQEPAA